MGAQIREYRQRIRSVSATKKITRAMELMAAARVVKAQQAVRESSPYARAITRAVSAVATFSNEEHVLTTEKEKVTRAAVVIITSDRGLAGAYSSAVLKESERLIARLRDEGKEAVPYLLGRKAVGLLHLPWARVRRRVDRRLREAGLRARPRDRRSGSSTTSSRTPSPRVASTRCTSSTRASCRW